MVSCQSHKLTLGVRLPPPQPVIDSSIRSDQQSKGEAKWAELQSGCIVGALLAPI